MFNSADKFSPTKYAELLITRVLEIPPIMKRREKGRETPIIIANQETVYPFSNHATSTRTLTTSRRLGQVLINRLDRGERERGRKPKARLRRNNSLELGGALTSWIREKSESGERREAQAVTLKARCVSA